MVLVPVAALAALGLRWIDDHTEVVRHEVERLATEQLRGVNDAIARHMTETASALLRASGSVPRAEGDIRRWLGEHPEVGGVLCVDREGKVVFPPMAGILSSTERVFLDRTRTVWEDRLLGGLGVKADAGEGARASSGWTGWFQGGGLNLMHWTAQDDRVVGLWLPRVRLLSDLVVALPSTEIDREDTARMALVDASGSVVYQWGSYVPDEGEPPRAGRALSPPLAAWSVRMHGRASDLPGATARTLRWNLGLGLGGLALALSALAGWLYREHRRESRLAAERISFVNRVSHELKTPLTSIRLYAELLESHLEGLDDDALGDKARSHLGIIVEESQRLSRLISNVLTFARGQQNKLVLRTSATSVDDVVRHAVAAHEAALTQAGVAVELRFDAPDAVAVDRDAVEQIVGNLLSNVEKYAAAGGRVQVTTRQDDRRVLVEVRDDGPGISRRHRRRIFEPFFRPSNKLTDGVAGAGIGLDIARTLARLHGGELRLLDSDAGAAFVLELPKETPS